VGLAKTVGGHYQVLKVNRKFFFRALHYDANLIGPHKTEAKALEAAQLMENDYHKHTPRKP